MDNKQPLSELCLSLLMIIVNRGKGSKVLDFAAQQGAADASCLLGKGTIKSKILKLIEMDEVEKEIIIIIVPFEKSQLILEELNKKFHLDKPNHGIAFTLPMIGALRIKCDGEIAWKNDTQINFNDYKHTLLLVIVDKDHGESVVKIAQDSGIFGGTIIKGRGTAQNAKTVLDMVVEPEKEAVIILLEKEKAIEVSSLLNEKLSLTMPNKGFLVKLPVSNTVGLFSDTTKAKEV